MNAVAYFEIHANNPEPLVAFYRQVFGWTFTKVETLPIPYWRISNSGIRGGLLRRPVPPPAPPCGTNAFICSIEVADIDATTSQILSLGGQVALPKFAIPGVCWHAYFLDPDANTFGLFQPDTSAGSPR